MNALRACAALTLLATLSACGDALAPLPAQARIEFAEVGERAGLTLVQESGDPRRWYIPESNGTGAAWLDYDGDGDLDLFVGNGQRVRYIDNGVRLEVARDARSALYRNDGGLRFTDVSAATGCDRRDWVEGVECADVDNDGDTDLYLGCIGPDVLLRNDGGRFVDATAESGLRNELWAAGAAFADVDNDGWLDLYVANYCLFDFDNPPNKGVRNVIKEIEVAWGPEEENKKGFNPGAPDVLFLGTGGGKFREATAERGLVLKKALCSYAAVFSDIDGDGDQDILVGNDMQPSNLFVNDGRGHFTEEGAARGFALGADGRATSAMGLVPEDVDFDGDFDVLRTNFDFEPNSLHVNDGAGRFADRARPLGLAAGSVDKLGWGAGFFDAELDGDLDVLIANGHVYPQAKEVGMSGWKMETQLYEAVTGSTGAVVWLDATVRIGGGLEGLHSARGLALGDPDEDGDIDALVTDLDQRPRLLENRSARGGRWLAVRLVGSRSNRDGIGAKVSVKAGGRTWTREARLTAGLYSSHDPRVHFGLGPVAHIDAVEVRWPSGARSVVAGPALDSILVVPEEPPSR